MAREHFAEQKSIKITKETWKRLRVRSAEVERPMTVLVEEAVVGYLAGHLPMVVPVPSSVVERRPRVCGWCAGPVPPEREPDREPAYCSAACEVAYVMEREGTPS